VSGFQVFVIRALLGGLIALVLMRVFHPDAPPALTILLAAALVGLAYLSHHFRNRKK
jgi:hypothetical protein